MASEVGTTSLIAAAMICFFDSNTVVGYKLRAVSTYLDQLMRLEKNDLKIPCPCRKNKVVACLPQGYSLWL